MAGPMLPGGAAGCEPGEGTPRRGPSGPSGTHSQCGELLFTGPGLGRSSGRRHRWVALRGGDAAGTQPLRARPPVPGLSKHGLPQEGGSLHTRSLTPGLPTSCRPSCSCSAARPATRAALLAGWGCQPGAEAVQRPSRCAGPPGPSRGLPGALETGRVRGCFCHLRVCASNPKFQRPCSSSDGSPMS